MKDELSFLEQVYKASPPVFALLVFMIVVIFLYRLGVLKWKDPDEDKWRERMEDKVAHVETEIAVIKAIQEERK
tara:strand:- start:72 stop:293 length:222 start_codon:yes stop_codon:yes gene_type:complete